MSSQTSQRMFGRSDAVTRVKDAELCGVTVCEAGLPAGAVLVGRIRGIHAKVPGADDTLEEGDHLYAVVEKRARRPFEKRVIR